MPNVIKKIYIEKLLELEIDTMMILSLKSKFRKIKYIIGSFDSYPEIDYVTFTSASTVHSFARIFKDIDFSKVNALCIGEKTASAAKQYGMNIYVSEKATIESMIEKLLEIEGE